MFYTIVQWVYAHIVALCSKAVNHYAASVLGLIAIVVGYLTWSDSAVVVGLIAVAIDVVRMQMHLHTDSNNNTHPSSNAALPKGSIVMSNRQFIGMVEEALSLAHAVGPGNVELGKGHAYISFRGKGKTLRLTAFKGLVEIEARTTLATRPLPRIVSQNGHSNGSTTSSQEVPDWPAFSYSDADYRN